MTRRSLPRRLLAPLGWLVRTALTFGLLVLAYELTWGSWTSERMSRAEAELNQLQGEVMQAEVTANKKRMFLEELRKIERYLEQAAAALPESSAASLPLELAQCAERAGLPRVDVSTPKGERLQVHDFFRSRPLRVEAHGPLATLAHLGDAVWRLPAVELEAVDLVRESAAAYSARLDLRAYEWIPDTGSALPTCERGEAALYAAADLVAAGRELDSSVQQGEGWRRRRVRYRVSRVFKPGAGAADHRWPRPGGTLLVMRTCLTQGAASVQPRWPAPIEPCRDGVASPAQASHGANADVGAAGEQLLFLTSSSTDVGWKPVGRQGLFGTCDAPVPAADEAGVAEMHAWRKADEAGRASAR